MSGGTEWSAGIELLIISVGPILGSVFKTKNRLFWPREWNKEPYNTDGWMGTRFSLDGHREEKISHTHRDSNPKTSIPWWFANPKTGVFLPCRYTHRPIALSEVSRQIQGAGSIICAELFSLFYFRHPGFSSKKSNLLHIKQMFLQYFSQQLKTSGRWYWTSGFIYITCDTAHDSFGEQEKICFLTTILHVSRDLDHFTHTNKTNTAITTGIISRSVVQFKRSALPVHLNFLRMLQTAVVTILLLLFATSNGFYRWVIFATSVPHILSFCTFRNGRESSCFLGLSRLHLVYLKEVNSHHFNCHC
jgi:hypothetical protein